MSARQEFQEMAWYTIWWVWLIIVILLSAIGLLIVRPYFLDLQNNQNQHSYEYVTSVKEGMASDYLKWMDLEGEIKMQKNPEVIAAKVAQQKALVREMRLKAQRIPGQVPPDLAEFLSGQ
jgi:hypothetical protein